MSSGSTLLLPESTHLIHIGPHKTGSTAIQVAADAQRSLLSAHGVHYAGEGLRPKEAGWALGLQGKPVDRDRDGVEMWDALVTEVSSAPGRVLVSNEDFGRATPEQAQRIVKELGGERPHVVLVARRLDRYLPSQWQERVKAGSLHGFEDWLGRVLADPYGEVGWDKSAPGYGWERSNVLHAHDPLRQVRRWSELVGPENVTLIVSDDSDRTLLPRTFESLLGLPAGTLEHDGGSAEGNASLSWGEIELVLDVNRRLEAHGHALKTRRRLAHRTVVPHLRYSEAGTDRRRPPLPRPIRELLVEFSRRRVADLQDSGIRVVGDLTDLEVPQEAEVLEDAVRPQVPVEVAADLVTFLLEQRLEIEEQRDGSRERRKDAAVAERRAKRQLGRARENLQQARAELEQAQAELRKLRRWNLPKRAVGGLRRRIAGK